MSLNIFKPSSFTVAFIGTLALAASAVADNGIEEVIVSASFRDTTVQEIPASITVINAETITRRGAQHLDDLLSGAANVNFAGGASRSKFVQIRGIGDIEQFKDPKHYPSVGLMIDDLDMSNLGTAATLFDIDQVEILRGPQGTRFGSAALGGMIKLKSALPEDKSGGRVVAGFSNYSGWELGAALGGPLADSLSGRIAIHQFKSNGYKENSFLNKDDTSNFDEQLVRARLHWNATDKAEFDFSILQIDTDNGYDAFSLDNTRLKTQSDQPGRDNQDSLAFSFTNRYQFTEQLTLKTTITGKDVELGYGFDEDWSNTQLCIEFSCPFGGFNSTDFYLRERDESSVDIRLLSDQTLEILGDWRWLVGIYHQQRDEDLVREYFGQFRSSYEIDRSAVYGQMEFQLQDNLTMSSGLRVESFEDGYRDSNSTRLDSDDSLWGGELSLNYWKNENTHWYVTVSRGHKAGGVNTEANSSFPLISPVYQNHVSQRLSFDEETLVNWEIGVKTVSLDGRLSINAALFYMDRSDAQLEAWLYDAPAFTWVGYLDNTDADTRGIEFESQFKVNDKMTLFANLGLLKSELDDMTVFDLDRASFKNISNRSVARAPEYQYAVGSDIKLSRSLSLHFALEGRDDHYFAYYHNQKASSSNLLNASLSYQHQNWQLTLWGRNLTDQNTEIHGLYFAADPRDGWTVNRTHKQYGEPITYGLGASYSF